MSRVKGRAIFDNGYRDTEKNGARSIRRDVLLFDLRMLLKARQITKAILANGRPLLELLCLMGIGTGLLFIYAFAHIGFDTTAGDDTRYLCESPKSTRVNNREIADSSALEKELYRLKSKTHSLDMALRKMRLQYRNCRACKDREADMPDFASEAAGGSVIATPDTESYYETNHSRLTLFGIPLWRSNYFTPRKVIQPWAQPGECWAFRGSRGKIELQLAYAAIVTHVTLEHIPVSASLTGTVASAPQKFIVHGEFKDSYLPIDTFVYNIEGLPVQTFPVKNSDVRDIPFRRIMLEVVSNWGDPDYTCIYRFKVHGKMFQTFDWSSPNPKGFNEL